MDQLLMLLRDNAALSPARLAQMLNLSETEVASRIKAYENDQVILGYRAILDEEKLGVDLVRAVIEVKITPERGPRNVLWVVEVTMSACSQGLG